MNARRMKSVDSSDRSLNVTFDGLRQTVKTGVSRTKKELLHNISGDFRCGELTAILGPSGAGKSTLIDVLAGFMPQTSGTVSIGDSPRNLASFRRSSVYIMQDDYLEPLLTVQESMHIAADLKLRSGYYNKSQRIEQIVVAMGLDKCRHTRTSELSGGQRKRLAIALEIVNNPPVMFFDEPTSGLDSVTSKQCISLLRALAHEGPRTVIMTIHQPSATLLDMMDHLYVVAQGSCIYTGGTQTVIPYLGSHGLHCPTHYNPADFLMEIANGDYGDYNDQLIQSIENGRSNAWRSVSNDDVNSKLDNELNLELPQIDEMSSVTDSSAIYYATGFPKQLLVLMKRNFIRLSRDRVLTYTRLGMHCLIATFLGFVFYDIGEDAEKARHNTGLLYLSLMFLMFSAFSATIITFPSVLPIMVREHFNRWYKLRSFYLANKLADLPIQITAVSLYILIVYFMTGQIPEGRRFFLLSGTCLVVSLVAQSIGVIVGIALNVQNGVVFGPLFIMPFVIFSGFFAHLNDAPWYLQWLFHISFLKYGFQSVMAAMYGYDRSTMNCDGNYCHYKYPVKVLIDYDMQNVEYWLPMIFLFCLYLTLDIVAFIILRLKLKKIV